LKQKSLKFVLYTSIWHTR